MTDTRRQAPKDRERVNLSPVPPKPAVGEPNAFPTSIGQINAARRRNALKQMRELIKEHGFTLREIEESFNANGR